MNLRKPAFALCVMLLSAAMGIASRRWGYLLPSFLADFAGDTMWALAFFALFRMVLPRLKLWQVALLTFGFAIGIEFSQLWHPLWLDFLRQTKAGGLLLGFGFRWSDLICYASGSALGFLFFCGLEPDGKEVVKKPQ